MSLSFEGPQLDELAERRFERCLVDILAAGDASARTMLGAEAGRSGLKQQIFQAGQNRMSGDLEIALNVLTRDASLSGDFSPVQAMGVERAVHAVD